MDLTKVSYDDYVSYEATASPYLPSRYIATNTTVSTTVAPSYGIKPSYPICTIRLF